MQPPFPLFPSYAAVSRVLPRPLAPARRALRVLTSFEGPLRFASLIFGAFSAAKLSPPKCAIHCHSPQSPVLTFAGERGGRSRPRNLGLSCAWPILPISLFCAPSASLASRVLPRPALSGRYNSAFPSRKRPPPPKPCTFPASHHIVC